MATPQAETVHVTQEKSLLDRIAEEQAQVGSRYMPTLTVKQFSEREHLLRELKELLVEGIDYGVIPGTQKPTLLLPGAQKICTFFGYVPHYSETAIEEWTGDKYGEPLFYYKYTCGLWKSDVAVGEGIGSASSWESKYRYRWLREDQLPESLDKSKLLVKGGKQTLFAYDFAIEKAETSGQYGKPAEYWQQFKDAIANGTAKQVDKPFKNGKPGPGYEITLDATLYRVPNSDFADIINTCQKMGQKRAYIAATLSATGASQYFTQDLEDMDHIDTGGHAIGTQAAADHVAHQKIAQGKTSSGQPASTGHADPPTSGAVVPEGGGHSAPAPDPEVAALLKRCTNVKTFQEVCGELVAIIDKNVGTDAADKLWASAIELHGDPSFKRQIWEPFLKYLNDNAKVSREVAA